MHLRASDGETDVDARDVDKEIRTAICRVREWQWLIPLSTDPATALLHLRAEAKQLIELGLDCPNKAPQIGKIVVSYHRAMQDAQSRIDRCTQKAA